jgi:CubicO group peptidase (beta-lactamase class C family)
MSPLHSEAVIVRQVSHVRKVPEAAIFSRAAGGRPLSASGDKVIFGVVVLRMAHVFKPDSTGVRVIRSGDAVRPLLPHARSLADLTFEVNDLRLSVGYYMASRRTAGLLILKDGEIALERYGWGSGPESRRTSYSAAKSMTSTLVGAALYDGAIGSLDDRCDLYLPQLRGSAYEGVTVRNVMRMCSGVAWSEQDDGRADAARLQLALAIRRPGAILDLACSLPRAQSQGTVFNYSTVESCVLGAVVAAATSRPLADYCGETIWGPAGMEASGYWALEADEGQEPGGFGLSACLRDIGRFGLLVLEDGEAFTGGCCRPAGAISPASRTAPPPPSVDSRPAPAQDTATNGGRCRTGRPVSMPAPFLRAEASASTSTSILPRG